MNNVHDLNTDVAMITRLCVRLRCSSYCMLVSGPINMVLKQNKHLYVKDCFKRFQFEVHLLVNVRVSHHMLHFAIDLATFGVTLP